MFRKKSKSVKEKFYTVGEIPLGGEKDQTLHKVLLPQNKNMTFPSVDCRTLIFSLQSQ